LRGASLIGSFLSYCSSTFGESQFIGQVTLHRAVNRGRLHVEPSYLSGHTHQWRLCKVRGGQRLSWIITAGLTTTQHKQCHLKKQNKTKTKKYLNSLNGSRFKLSPVDFECNFKQNKTKQNKKSKSI